jgi:hypothetical protein
MDRGWIYAESASTHSRTTSAASPLLRSLSVEKRMLEKRLPELEKRL